MKRLLLILPVMAAIMAPACSGSAGRADHASLEDEPVQGHSIDITSDTVGQWSMGDSIAPARGVKLKTNWPGGSYAEVFNDSNYVHWADAEKIGIDPIVTTRDHWQLKRPLVKIASCEYYYVEPLTFSKPYMVPEGAEMVNEIGRRFHDSLQARGGGDYRLRITSVTRTADNVRRLRRRNRNAVDSSVHKFGTTVDISWARFTRDSETCTDRGSVDLKALLAEVLLDMRREGKIWVKYEMKQPCFHITARPKNN